MRRLRLPISSVTLLAYLLTCRLAGASVLCIGAEGHISIEAFGASCCGPEGAEAGERGQAQFTSGPSADGMDDAHCGSCVDIPLGSARFVCTVTPRPKRMPQPHVPSFADGAPAALQHDFTFLLSLTPSMPGGASIAHLRTVVLRC